MSRIPASRFYKSGSTFPRYRKPAAKVLAGIRISSVRQHLGRQWYVEFTDGYAVNVHESDTLSGRFYTLRVHDRVRYYDEARPEPPEALAHAYQYVALTAIVPHQSAFHLLPRSSGGRSDLIADVHDELYPMGRDPRRARSVRRVRRARRPLRRTR